MRGVIGGNLSLICLGLGPFHRRASFFRTLFRRKGTTEVRLLQKLQESSPDIKMKVIAEMQYSNFYYFIQGFPNI